MMGCAPSRVRARAPHRPELIASRALTIVLPSLAEQREQHVAALLGQHEAGCGLVAIDQAPDHHVLRRRVCNARLLPVGIRGEAEEQESFRDGGFSGGCFGPRIWS